MIFLGENGGFLRQWLYGAAHDPWVPWVNSCPKAVSPGAIFSNPHPGTQERLRPHCTLTAPSPGPHGTGAQGSCWLEALGPQP